jgi:ParB family transcriptional regulator, chromosome partitioning protein
MATSLNDAFSNPVGSRIGAASALFEGAAGASDHFRRIPIERIRPRCDGPRRSLDDAQLEELVASIRAHGVLQPIRLRSCGSGDYEVVAGERRRQAAQRAGLRHIPAVITTADDEQAYLQSLVENVQREDLNAVDRAHALRHLRVHLGLQSWEEVGRAVGLTRQHVHNLLRVTDLPEPMQDDIRAGGLTEKHSRALLRLREQPEAQAELWERIHREQLSGDSAIVESKRVSGTASVQATAKAPSAEAPRGVRPRIGPAVDALLQVLGQAGLEEVTAARGELAELGQVIADLLGGLAGAQPPAAVQPLPAGVDAAMDGGGSWRPMLMPVVGRQGG